MTAIPMATDATQSKGQLMDEMVKLAERCLKATGRDRELNADILEALADERWRKLEYEASLPCGAPPDMIRTEARYKAGIRFDFTASLDAALTLVPEGCAPWHCGKHNKTGKHPRTGRPVDGGGDAYLTFGTNEPIYTMAATPALALCAAALRAQATSRGGETPANLKQGSQDSDPLKVRATFAQESGVSRNNDGGDNG